ncbi:MAG: N-acetylmuramoyl-L-alanine amidase [Clostridia bacterium]|nr:N-acetylmuramoyl-L-alanine amidase [Clostridia bacterium]
MSIKIALDAGHGLNTAGKQTPDGIKEWSLNDKVCDKIQELLCGYDLEIIRLDNDEGRVDESLQNRFAKYIKSGVKLIVSIHHNALKSDWSSATGVEVYTDKNPTAEDAKLAEIIYNKMVAYTGLRGRGIKQSDFYIINQDRIPAVLCEGGFMDGENDYKIITSEAGQKAYAKSVSEGIAEFLGLNKVADKQKNEIDVIYQVWDSVQKRWLPNVKNDEDYAGVFGHSVCGAFANLTSGNIIYAVHYKGGKWLPEVRNRSDYAGIYGKSIDGLMMKTDTEKTLKYRIHLKKAKKWLPWVTGYNKKDSENGYAGILGQEIDAIQIKVV